MSRLENLGWQKNPATFTINAHFMMRTRYVKFLAAAGLIIFFYCAYNFFKVPVAKPAPKPWGVFEGILPCADCTGLKTELTIYDSLTVESYRYIFKGNLPERPAWRCDLCKAGRLQF